MTQNSAYENMAQGIGTHWLKKRFSEKRLASMGWELPAGITEWRAVVIPANDCSPTGCQVRHLLVEHSVMRDPSCGMLLFGLPVVPFCWQLQVIHIKACGAP